MKTIVNKWDFENHCYNTICPPDNWVVTTLGKLDDEINCVCCGKPVLVEDCYTSYQYQDSVGFGYMICGVCAKKEWDLRKRYSE